MSDPKLWGVWLQTTDRHGADGSHWIIHFETKKPLLLEEAAAKRYAAFIMRGRSPTGRWVYTAKEFEGENHDL
jgi:hypothetical protein